MITAPSRVSAGEAATAATAVLETALTAAQFAAQFTPVPALAPALQAVISIIQTCNNITSNQSEIKLLQERCTLLVEAINDPQYINSKSAESLIEISAKATAHLQEVQRLLNKHTRHNRWEAFFNQSQISKDIETCHREIDNCCAEFSIKLSLQLRDWQEEHSRAYERDQSHLFRVLEHLSDNDAELIQTVNATREHVEIISKLLQDVISSTDVDSLAQKKIQRGLYKLNKRNGVLPLHTNLTAEVSREGFFAVGASSAAFEVWLGSWLGQEKVAMKTIRGARVSPNGHERLLREVEIWRQICQLDHGRYILPLYGVTFDHERIYMISPWMANGDIMDYLQRYPNCDRVKLIKRIAEGLKFLHGLQPPIAHGDIRGSNILINSNGDPLIADFGLTKMVEEITGVPFTQSQGAIEAFRWFSPEMCTPGVISTCSDVFEFAMTVIEIMTMNKPYDHIEKPIDTLLRMQAGERPRRPQNMDDRLWEICTACWRHTPTDRPTMAWVVEKFENPN